MGTKLGTMLAALWLVAWSGCTSSREADAVETAGSTETVEFVAPLAGIVALCGPEEPGDRLQFSGRVLDYAGRPLSKAAVVAYNADRDGLYNPRDGNTRVPRMRGVAITDDEGRFAFSTVRPGAYPNGSEPAHIHLSVSAPAHHVKYVDYWFDDDPLVTAERRTSAAIHPGTVIVKPRPDANGVASFADEIRLEGN